MKTRQKVLVVGIDGFIGQCLARGLKENGYIVYGAGKKSYSAGDCEYITCLEKNDLRQIITDFQIDKIYYVDYKDSFDQLTSEEMEELAEETGVQTTSIYTVNYCEGELRSD